MNDHRRVAKRACLAATTLLLTPSLWPGSAAAQVGLQNVVVSMGSSGNVYLGNLTTVNASLRDSAEKATAASAELSARGTLVLMERTNRSVLLSLNGDLRQTAALGFVTRDYAPTEWSGGALADYQQQLGGALLSATAGIEGRSLRDRPPMPLFMQPGYLKATGGALLRYPGQAGTSVDAQVRLRTIDYGAPPNFAQLDLLDSRAFGLEAGASRRRGESFHRVYLGLDAVSYAGQNGFDVRDPHRRDRTYRLGLSWQREARVFFRGNLEGIANRSNSRRPEYNTIRAETFVQVPLPGGYFLQALVNVTNKHYIHETDFARLVPGEEADSRSEVWVGVSRQVAEGLDARLQLEWARAETDISNAYFRSYGLSLALDYRPPW